METLKVTKEQLREIIGFSKPIWGLEDLDLELQEVEHDQEDIN